MAAPSLPRGVVGPTRADFSSDRQVAQFVTVYASPAEAWVWQTSGRQFLQDLNSALGRRREAIISADGLAALRDRLRAAGVDVSQVSASRWDRETLRAALWYAYRSGFAGGAQNPGIVWLPSSLEFPPLGVVIAGTDTPRPAPVRLTPSGAATAQPSASGPTAAQRAAARDLDAYVRAHPSIRSNVRDLAVEGYQRAMGGVSVDGQYGASTRARMVALGVASPVEAPRATTGTPDSSSGGGGGGGGQAPIQAGALGGASMGAKALAALVGIGLVLGAAVALNDDDDATKRRGTIGAPARSGAPRVPPRPTRPTGRAPTAARVPYARGDERRRRAQTAFG